jgi:hypothetical protein
MGVDSRMIQAINLTHSCSLDVVNRRRIPATVHDRSQQK